jgi:hypothetical protein
MYVTLINGCSRYYKRIIFLSKCIFLPVHREKASNINISIPELRKWVKEISKTWLD